MLGLFKMITGTASGLTINLSIVRQMQADIEAMVKNVGMLTDRMERVELNKAALTAEVLDAIDKLDKFHRRLIARMQRTAPSDEPVEKNGRLALWDL